MPPNDNQNPLAQLHGIIDPDTASSWPPPFIYWLLAVLVIILLAAAVYFFKKYKEKKELQKKALQELNQLNSSKGSFASLNQLLKGTALLYFPRSEVASLHGELWFEFLQNYSAETIFQDKQTFSRRLYHSTAQPCSADDFQQAGNWIKNLPHQIKKQQKESSKNV
ncbi:DUF4381 domain-containing protein [Psychromonas aquimarina]|uniref:DUF4381 domain-containing protein n=1 Tax=Psychromonas aquimarina TaxID=444919 RepID=UPI0004194322|nr:DUF4381 domain-containing protein [Psychromonas aquimarina]